MATQVPSLAPSPIVPITPSPSSPTATATPTPIAALRSAAPASVVTPSGRMTLANVKRGRVHGPLRLGVFGVEGVGKSGFAAAAPDPIFICAEDGVEHLDVPKFPTPQDWNDVLCALDELLSPPSKFKTVVIDTLDWIEPMCWAHVSALKYGGKPIPEVGFAKGFEAAIEEWRIFFARLARLRAEKGMNYILLAHHNVKSFANPEGDDYARYETKLHHKAGALFREGCDAWLFANHETSTLEKEGRTKGISTGRRVLYTTRTAAYDAKNRLNLPEKIPLEWEAFSSAVQASRSLADHVDTLIAKADTNTAASATAWLRAKPRTMRELTEMKDRLEAHLAKADTTTNTTAPNTNPTNTTSNVTKKEKA